MTKRLGILTGGGDCPGLNAVIRAVVKTAIREHDFEVIGIEEGFEGLMQSKHTTLTMDTIRGILPKGGTLLRTTNRGNPFSYPCNPENPAERADMSAVAMKTVADLGLDCLIVIGGEGTLGIADSLSDLGVPVVGVPKTIDNDIAETDYTFGFWTAVAIATEAVDRLHTTAESHNRVMILEVMGRHTGWIALHAGLAGGADIILIPEIPYSPQRIIETIEQRQAYGSSFDIIVVAEGASRAGGAEVWLDKDTKRLGGIAFQVADDIARHIDLETRVTVLGHVQRGGSPIAFDRVLATRYGRAAAHMAAEGQFGMMASLHGRHIVPVPIKNAVQALNLVSRENELVQTALSVGISFGD